MMKFHALPEQVKHTNYSWPVALCGKAINLISQFGYTLEQFQTHYATEYRCKSCDKAIKQQGGADRE